MTYANPDILSARNEELHRFEERMEAIHQIGFQRNHDQDRSPLLSQLSSNERNAIDRNKLESNIQLVQSLLIQSESISPDELERISRPLFEILIEARCGLETKEMLREAHENWIQAVRSNNQDELTGISNSKALNEAWPIYFRMIRDQHEEVVIIISDLRMFKSHNDSFGHPSGDRILVAFFQLFTNLVRKSDIVFRIGGDEGLAILHNPTSVGTERPNWDEQAVLTLREQINGALERTCIEEARDAQLHIVKPGDIFKRTQRLIRSLLRWRPTVAPDPTTVDFGWIILRNGKFAAKHFEGNQILTSSFKDIPEEKLRDADASLQYFKEIVDRLTYKSKRR